MKRHQEEIMNMRKGIKDDHKKRMREAVERARAKILNNGSVGSTNDAVQDLSMRSPTRKLFDEKKIRMTGVEF